MSQHGETMRRRLRELRRAVPFRPFEVVMANGDRVSVNDAFHIGFDPVEGGNDSAYVLTERSFYRARLEQIREAVVRDADAPAGASAAG